MIRFTSSFSDLLLMAVVLRLPSVCGDADFGADAKFSDNNFFWKKRRASANSSLLTPTVLNRLLRCRENRFDEADERSAVGDDASVAPVSCGINLVSNNSVGSRSVSENIGVSAAISLDGDCRIFFSHATSVRIVLRLRVSVTGSCSFSRVACSRFNACDNSVRMSSRSDELSFSVEQSKQMEKIQSIEDVYVKGIIYHHLPCSLSSFMAEMSDCDAFDALERRDTLFSWSIEFLRRVFDSDSLFGVPPPPAAISPCNNGNKIDSS